MTGSTLPVTTARRPTGASLIRRLLARAENARRVHDSSVVPAGGLFFLRAIGNLIAKSDSGEFYEFSARFNPGGLPRAVAGELRMIGPEAEGQIERFIHALRDAELIEVIDEGVRLPLPPVVEAPADELARARAGNSPGRRSWERYPDTAKGNADWEALKTARRRLREAADQVDVLERGQTAMLMVLPGGVGRASDKPADISKPEMNAEMDGAPAAGTGDISADILASGAAAAALRENAFQTLSAAAAVARAPEHDPPAYIPVISAQAEILISAAPDINAAPSAAAIASVLRGRFDIREPTSVTASVVARWLADGADDVLIAGVVDDIASRPQFPAEIRTAKYFSDAIADALRAGSHAASPPRAGPPPTRRFQNGFAQLEANMMAAAAAKAERSEGPVIDAEEIPRTGYG